MFKFDKLRQVSEFYNHPYGGVARDVVVGKDGFCRFFGISEDYCDDLPINMKVLDDIHDMKEMLGYKIMPVRGGRIEYRITIIDYRKRLVA